MSLDLLSAEIRPGAAKALEQLLAKAKQEKRQLRVKLGIDPTSSDLHLGHMVCIQVLKQFQAAGHLPVLIIGGYTAQVGDPSGRNEARPPLSREDVTKHAKTYLDQVARVLDLSKAEVHNNADWFEKFSMTDIVKLAAKVTINQMLAKDAFGNRLDEGHPLYMHEIFYPVLQGYDSVQIKADIELGGNDQIFNLMVGRDLQKVYGQEPQIAITMPLLIGLDGQKKMSKTSGNYIGLTDSPAEIFAKIMSISDEMIPHYYELAASASAAKLAEVKAALADAKVNPRDIKAALGKTIVEIYYSASDAESAEQQFTAQFKQNIIPDDIPEISLSQLATKLATAGGGSSEGCELAQLMVEAGLSPSRAESKRLVAGGGVKLDGAKIEDPFIMLSNTDANKVLQIGKRKFVRLVA